MIETNFTQTSFYRKATMKYVSDNNQILVILDLDETLIHATETPGYGEWHFELDKYKIYIRPGLSKFLEKLKESFRVAVWSSASDDYVKQVVEKIFPLDYPLEFVWGRSRCTLKHDQSILEQYGYSNCYSHQHYVKPLVKVKKKGIARLEKILIIDDTPAKSRLNYGNAIYPLQFNGDPNDNELIRLIEYLKTLKLVENVREIEKRNWRENNN